MCSIGEGEAPFYSLRVRAEGSRAGHGGGGSASVEGARRGGDGVQGVVVILWMHLAG